MDHFLTNAEEVFSRHISGFHLYILKPSIRLSYVSESLCRLTGYTREELLDRDTDIYSALLHPSDAPLFSEFLRRLASEEKMQTAQYRLVRKDGSLIHVSETASCGRLSDGTPVAYCVLVELTPMKGGAEQSQKPPLPSGPLPLPTAKKVYVRTFGYFDVFINEIPIAFRNQKSKELLALLIDRRGGYVSSEEAISYLWENEPINQVTMARYRKVAMRLKLILEEYGISDIVRTVNGKRCIVPGKVRCDLYNYLSGEEKYSQLFKGSYLTNYSWGEVTLAELSGV